MAARVKSGKKVLEPELAGRAWRRGPEPPAVTCSRAKGSAPFHHGVSPADAVKVTTARSHANGISWPSSQVRGEWTSAAGRVASPRPFTRLSAFRPSARKIIFGDAIKQLLAALG